MADSAKPRVLVIDDEIDVLLMTREYFELRGYQVFTALDGETGLLICRYENPKLVLVDYKLKTCDGAELIRSLRKTSNSLKIFVISAHQEENMERRVTGLGADKYFEKPVSIIEVERAARQILNFQAS